ncbi:MAG TPA: hypothetical protein VI702_04690, partial [Nitrospiria bacterium]
KEVAPGINLKRDSVYALSVVNLPQTAIYAGFSGLKLCNDSDGCFSAGSYFDTAWVDLQVPSDRGVSALAVDPYTQTLMITGNYIGELFRSIDGGASWAKISIGN